MKTLYDLSRHHAISNVTTVTRRLDISVVKRVFLLQRPWVLFPAPTAACNSSSKDPKALLLPWRHLHARGYMPTCGNVHTHKQIKITLKDFKRRKKRKSEEDWGKSSVTDHPCLID